MDIRRAVALVLIVTGLALIPFAAVGAVFNHWDHDGGNHDYSGWLDDRGSGYSGPLDEPGSGYSGSLDERGGGYSGPLDD